MDKGFHDAGFETCLAIDKCRDAVQTFNRNSPLKVAIKRDLSRLTPEKFLKLIPADAQPVGLIGGPPCQGFSRGNVSADPNDPRNKLPFRYATLLAAAREKYNLKFFVFENVTGLLSSKHYPRFLKIIERFEEAGFNVFYKKLNAADFGVPQRRHRLFIVGLNKNQLPGLQFVFPEPVDASLSVKKVIGNLPDPKFYSRGLTSEQIPYHPNHWTMAPKSPRFEAPMVSNKNGRSFRLLEWDAVSPTVAYGNREIHIHPDGRRRLTILEAMLLQGFDDKFQITGTLSSQVTQVSNAVPPPLAKVVADALVSILTEAKNSKASNSLS